MGTWTKKAKDQFAVTRSPKNEIETKRRNMKTGNQIKIAPRVASRRGFNTRTAVASLPLFMHQTFLALAVCAAIGVGGVTLAQHTGKAQVKVTNLSHRDI